MRVLVIDAIYINVYIYIYIYGWQLGLRRSIVSLVFVEFNSVLGTSNV